jgi:hypothetical protein
LPTLAHLNSHNPSQGVPTLPETSNMPTKAVDRGQRACCMVKARAILEALPPSKLTKIDESILAKLKKCPQLDWVKSEADKFE